MIETFRALLAEEFADPDDVEYLTVAVPGDIDPLERHHRFSVHIDAELRLSGLGCSVGGGTLYFEPADDDAPDELEIAYCIVDVDATDVAGARGLLRLHLPELGAPSGTLIQFGEREDRFDGVTWLLDQPRSLEE